VIHGIGLIDDLLEIVDGQRLGSDGLDFATGQRVLVAEAALVDRFQRQI